MAVEEVDKSLFTAEAVADMLAHPSEELRLAIKAGLEDALKDSAVQEAFRAMFTEEELESLVGVETPELAGVLHQELATDETFRNAIQESLDEWMSGVSIAVPQDADAVDALIAEWQIPTGEEAPQA